MDKKILDGTKKSAKDALKTTSKRQIQKAAEQVVTCLEMKSQIRLKKLLHRVLVRIQAN